jgi:uncharacterized protein (DUF433 family)
MPTLTSERGIEPIRRRLFLPAYRIKEAARYAGTTVQSVTYWHYGGGKLGPALPGSVPRRPLSYMELIEVAFVAFFRNIGVPLQRIRSARDYVAQNFNAEYPFVEHRFKTEGAHILMDFAEFASADDFKQVVVADDDGQLAWEQMASNKFAEFDYEVLGQEMLALKWHPAGRDSKVVIDPRVSFGAPTVNGVPTWSLKGRYETGESVEDIIEDFQISKNDTLDALNFEGIQIAV